MQSPDWREKLNQFLKGQHEVRYESIHKEIFYRCRFKIDGRWRRAQISFETGKILIRGEEVRRCNTCYKQLKLIEKLKNRVVLLWKQKEQIDKEKIELKLQNQDMNFNLSMLSEESKRFLEWKYGEGKSVEWIATEMFGGARATAYRKREELVEDIAQWCNFVG